MDNGSHFSFAWLCLGGSSCLPACGHPRSQGTFDGRTSSTLTEGGAKVSAICILKLSFPLGSGYFPKSHLLNWKDRSYGIRFVRFAGESQKKENSLLKSLFLDTSWHSVCHEWCLGSGVCFQVLSKGTCLLDRKLCILFTGKAPNTNTQNHFEIYNLKSPLDVGPVGLELLLLLRSLLPW